MLSNGCEVAFYDVLRSKEDALLLHSFEPRGTSLETSKLTQYPQLSDWSGNILELAFPSLAASSVWWVVISVLLAKDQRMVTLDSRFWCRGRWTRRCLALLNVYDGCARTGTTRHSTVGRSSEWSIQGAQTHLYWFHKKLSCILKVARRVTIMVTWSIRIGVLCLR